MINQLFFDILDSKGKKVYYQNEKNYASFSVSGEIWIFRETYCLFVI